MNKFGNCPLCGKQVKPTNLRKIARQNQLYGFRMALDGIATTWGALIQNLRCDADPMNRCRKSSALATGTGKWSGSSRTRT